jgi:hypothetical protein
VLDADVKFQQPRNGLLTPDDVYYNVIFNYWRLRVEHIIGDVKNHDMFSGVFRGSYVLLKGCLDLTVHLTNIKLKFALPRYDTTGRTMGSPAWLRPTSVTHTHVR